MKKQVILIHGGDTHDSYEEYIKFLRGFRLNLEWLKNKKWKSSMGERLGGEYEVIAPEMPNKINSRYFEWKIFFENLLPLLEKNIILVGHSLGGIFLAKYISENSVPNNITSLFMIAAPFEAGDYSLGDFELKNNLTMVEDQCQKIFLYQSKDDPVVPFYNVDKYKEALPKAELQIFEDRQHFNQEEFPELVAKIKEL